MNQWFDMTVEEVKGTFSLDQHRRELVALNEKLKRPNLPSEKRGRLTSRVPVVRRKIDQLEIRLPPA